jgi:hypothetical protein
MDEDGQPMRDSNSGDLAELTSIYRKRVPGLMEFDAPGGITAKTRFQVVQVLGVERIDPQKWNHNVGELIVQLKDILIAIAVIF